MVKKHECKRSKDPTKNYTDNRTLTVGPLFSGKTYLIVNKLNKVPEGTEGLYIKQLNLLNTTKTKRYRMRFY